MPGAVVFGRSAPPEVARGRKQKRNAGQAAGVSLRLDPNGVLAGGQPQRRGYLQLQDPNVGAWLICTVLPVVKVRPGRVAVCETLCVPRRMTVRLCTRVTT